MTDQIDFTAKRGGYFRVWVNDAQISQHTTEREALEKASEEALNAPDASVRIDHDYHVEVSVNPPGNIPPPVITVTIASPGSTGADVYLPDEVSVVYS